MSIRAFSIFIGILFLTVSASWLETAHSAVPKKEIIMRASEHVGYSRVVFEAPDDAFIRGTVVTTLQNQIKIQFPADVDLKVRTKIAMQTSLTENSYTINVSPPFKVKVSQLSSPPRLSIDIMQPAKAETVKPPVPESAIVIPNIRIVLDPGHGGYDLGIVAGDVREKDSTLSIARAMEAALIRRSRTVYLTRKADQYLSITDRALFANRKSADVFISIHLTRSGSFIIYTSPVEAPAPDSSDETYVITTRQRPYVEKSKALAEAFGKVIKDQFNRDVLFRKMELPLLDSVGAPAIMVEVPTEIVSDPAAKTKLVETFLRGVAAYAVQ
jgi:N-acetylmuramoyl-L-alanine amidase